ncbi:hypothetical protein FJZ20_00650 [Candidatus Pacearchaeota archaeon]|nr:hypothetical protein [Candidatus Pacearchaeota archaeon]
MNFKTWANSRVKKMNWVDMQFVKISVIGFTLMIAKLWNPLLGLNWYWYALIFVLAAIKPFSKALNLCKK